MKEEKIAYNSYGSFIKGGDEYEITNPNTPLPWSHVLANENFGTLISSHGIVYSFCKNSSEFKLTNWANDWTKLNPGEWFEGIYDKNYTLKFGFGYANIQQKDEDGIEKEMLIYVPRTDKLKIQHITIKNKSNELKNIKIKYIIDPVLGNAKEVSQKYIVTKEYSINNRFLALKNPYNSEFKNEIAYIHSTYPGTEYICKEEEEYALISNVILEPKSEVSFSVFFGCETTIGDIEATITKYSNQEELENEYENTVNYWKEKVKQEISTGDEYLDIMANGWLLYQTIACRLYAKTSFYQAGGAIGYRDQLQDTLALIRTWPSKTRTQIHMHANKQFEKGDVLHWWHPHNDRGIRTFFSDDYLWLPYVTSEYIELSGDKTILNETARYLENKEIPHGVHEYYDYFGTLEFSESIYEHCLRAIKYGLSRKGENGLLNIGDGDWNDGFSSIRGQSVWLTFFMMDVLKRFVVVAEIQGDEENKLLFEKERHLLKNAILEKAWDGEHFTRAFFANGDVLGSMENDECMIDLISQAWSAIALKEYKDCRNEVNEALASADKFLVDKENKIVRLLYPSFDNTQNNPGYIKAYVPGVRENGGQYTHGAIWLAKAYFEIDEKEKGTEILQLLNSIYHSDSKKSADIYMVEPYVVAADVYTNPEHLGRGGWTWYTGSSSWMYKVIEDNFT